MTIRQHHSIVKIHPPTTVQGQKSSSVAVTTNVWLISVAGGLLD